jgi:hypothetical protein
MLLILMPRWFGSWIYIIYGAVPLFILLFYVLGRRKHTEVREMDFYTPSFVLTKERR